LSGRHNGTIRLRACIPIHYLIDNGANIDAEGINKITPLQFAATDGNLDIVKLLVEAGADINRKNPHYNETAIELASVEGHRRTETHLRNKLGGKNADSRSRNN